MPISRALFIIAGLEIVIGVLFILGAFTQYAALISMTIAGTAVLWQRKLITLFPAGRLFYILLWGASLSLFVTGAGALAFDLPI